MINLPKRTQNLSFSPIRKLVPLAEQAKKRGVKIYHLNIGQPDIKSPAVFLQKVKEFEETVVAYEKSDGSERFKQSLKTYYQKIGISLETSEMVITTGGSEALWMIFFILFNNGDECLTLDPTYTNYLTFAQLGGVKLKATPTYLENNFRLPPLEDIKKAVSKKTKAIIITNPSNPTGAVYGQKMLKELVEFCIKKNIFIISDETYREFIYGRTKTVSLLSFKKAKELVIVADSLSKRYSLCGARLGLLASKNKAVIEAANKIAQARLASGTIEQYAASFLNRVPKSYFAKVRQEYQKRRDVLIAGLEKIKGVKASHPSGAFYLIAQLPVANAEDFCRFLLDKFEDKKETVMLAPAEGFYVNPGLGVNQVRIAYVLNTKEIKRACELIEKGLMTYRT